MSTHPADPKEPPRTAGIPAPLFGRPVLPAADVPGLPQGRTAARRSARTRLRSAAATSVLAAFSVTGVGAAPAQAREAREAAWSFPVEDGTAMPGLPAAAGLSQDGAERLAGVRRDLANAVAWGSVTASQAEHFYSQISARIARGL